MLLSNGGATILTLTNIGTEMVYQSVQQDLLAQRWYTRVYSRTYRHRDGIPECTAGLIEPIYEGLSSPDLGKCLHGKTQNNNECLNKVIWDHCGKEVVVGTLTIEESDTVIQWYSDTVVQ